MLALCATLRETCRTELFVRLADRAARPTIHRPAQRLAAFCMQSAFCFRMRCCLLVGNRKTMPQAQETEPALVFGVLAHSFVDRSPLKGDRIV